MNGYEERHYDDAERPWGEQRLLVDDDYELRVAAHVDIPDLDAVFEQTIEAYALTFDTDVLQEARDGGRCYVRYAAHAFDDWLAGDDPDHYPDESLDVFLNHGWGPRRFDTRGGVDHPIGQVVQVRLDETGLWTRSVYDGDEHGAAVMELIRAGKLTQYSHRAEVREQEYVGTRDGLPMYLITRAALIEVGPTDDPADAEARILTLGGEPVERQYPEDPFAQFSDADVAEFHRMCPLDDLRALERTRLDQRLEDHAHKRLIDELRDGARQVKAARTKVMSLHRQHEAIGSGHIKAQIFDEGWAAVRAAEALTDELRAMMPTVDEWQLNDLLASVGCPPSVNPFLWPAKLSGPGRRY